MGQMMDPTQPPPEEPMQLKPPQRSSAAQIEIAADPYQQTMKL